MSQFDRQLHLSLELAPEPALSTYFTGANAETVTAITTLVEGRSAEPFIFLCGDVGTGKTHLLQGACLAVTERGGQAHYVPLEVAGLTPSVLDNLEQLDLVAIDDIESIIGNAAWERALFDLFNRLREHQRRLLAAARRAPDGLPIALSDLRSRLQWGPCYRLHPLNDQESGILLQQTAHQRGLILGAELVRYIMNYHARDPASLLDLLARIDALSLREQRQPTLPMIRSLMRDQ